MKSELRIKNFGPIKDLNIKIGKLLVLIGEQASGKSTIAKLLAIFNDYNFVITANFESFFRQYNIQNYFNSDTLIEFVCPYYYIEYRNKELIIHRLSIDSDTGVIGSSSSVYSSKRVENGQYNPDLYHKAKKLYEETKNIRQYYVLKEIKEAKNWGEEPPEFINRTSVYIPAERFLISMLSGHAIEFLGAPDIFFPKYVTKFGSLYNQAKASMEENMMKITPLKLIFYKRKDFDVIRINGKKIRLSESASGYQSLIPIAVVLNQFASEKHSKLITIEEPELNLYPKTQKRLIDYLIDNCYNTSYNKRSYITNRLIITTHSPYILTSINNLIYAGNIAQRKEIKVKEIIDKNLWISYKDVKAFHIENGYAENIWDNELNLIKAEEVDRASMDINKEFDQLFKLDD